MTTRCEVGSPDCIGVGDTTVRLASDDSLLQVCLPCWYHDQDSDRRLKSRVDTSQDLHWDVQVTAGARKPGENQQLAALESIHGDWFPS